jgi:UDP-N-acetylglucosamine 1-carboxyvinyltransferase
VAEQFWTQQANFETLWIGIFKMARFIITGGKKLKGKITPAGNKNAALPMLVAALLTDETVELNNFPIIDDCLNMLRILEELGVDVQLENKTVKLRANKIKKREISRELCDKLRGSILLAGPMVARAGKLKLFPPGGDVIGRRRIDTHIEGLSAIGVDFCSGKHYTFSRKGVLKGNKIWLDEASVTATENIMMAATLAEDETTIFNAACEPHVRNLGELLIAMGADISGLGTNKLLIRGAKKLHGTSHNIMPDHIEAGSFLAAAAATSGEIELEVAGEDFIPIIKVLRRVGMDITLDEHKIAIAQNKKMKILNDFGNAMLKVEDGAWPNFPSDLMSVAIVASTQAYGNVLFFEKMFESRMYFVDRLIDMGARIVQCDPHRIVVDGPSKLHAVPLSSPDIRAGMAMIIAALCAKGTTIINNANVIDRGYEKIDEKLRSLGAAIEREE